MEHKEYGRIPKQRVDFDLIFVKSGIRVVRC